MSLAFYFDHHVPAAIAVALVDRGVDVLTAIADGHERTPDDDLLERATSLDRVLVTQDHDFLEIVHRHLVDEHFFAGLVFCRLQRSSVGTIVDDLEVVARVLGAEEIANTIVRVPL